MHSTTNGASRAGGLIATALLLTSCGSGSPDEEATEAADGSATVVVENARPTLATTTENGQPSTSEDFDVPRESVEVPSLPQRVVSFDLGSIDVLDAVDAADALVGMPRGAGLPDYLDEYTDLPSVGTLLEPDYEAVAELEPDLIIVAARSTQFYDELSKIATVIDLTAAPMGAFDLEPAIERARQLGEVFGKADEVNELATQLEETQAEIQSLTADAGPALLLSVSGGEYFAFGEGSRFGYFFDVLGFTAAVPAAELPGEAGSPHGDTVSNEFILSVDPDWILVFDRGAATGETSTAEETLDNELVARTTAAQADQIVFIPAEELYMVISGLTTPRIVLDAVLEALRS